MTNPQKIQLTPWHGGECPVDSETKIFAIRNDGCGVVQPAKHIAWWTNVHGESYIVGYAVIDWEIIEPPHSTIIPPEVWAVLPEWAVCAVSDCSGVYATSRDAIFESEEWFANQCRQLTDFKGVIPAKCDPKDSLVWRPGCEPV